MTNVFLHWVLLVAFLAIGWMVRQFTSSLASVSGIRYRWVLAAAIPFMALTSVIFAIGASLVP